MSGPELKRTLGPLAAFSIGVGTMVGAGIFVFPGLAAREAGSAATLSFALGGVIALLVALCTAELATVFPRSGGAYAFVDRIFGPVAGSLVGLAQSVGLSFASAFYLVAFGRYAVEVLPAPWTTPGFVSTTTLALLAAIALAVVGLLGAKEAGSLQNVVVTTLIVALVGVCGYGLLRIATGAADAPPPFSSSDLRAVLPTTALVFTSYIGFVQITTVAGEVRDPHQTLPRTLLGSVVVVMLLYVAALLVTTSALSPDELSKLGESATIEVAIELFGSAGGTLMAVLGLLAALSSANASLLSASRTLYALARDGRLPASVSRVHSRFESPHVAVGVVAVVAAGLVLLGDLEVLAETAAALHLVIYAAVCASLWRRRRLDSADDAPFRVPWGSPLAILGAVFSVALVAYLEPVPLSLAAIVLSVAGVLSLRYRG